MSSGDGDDNDVDDKVLRCGYWLSHKGRPCRMLVKAERPYCGQHLLQDDHYQMSNQHKKRIPCPLDPKHSCFESRLEHHLTICNARVKTDLPHLKLNCNLRVCREGKEIIPCKVSLSSLPDDVLLAFIDKINNIHEQVVGTIKESVLSLEVVDRVISECHGSPSVLRHLRQTSSLLAHLQQAHLLDTARNPTCYVEFGAGRGQLTNLLTEAVTDTGQALFLLVDRGAQRYKYDTKLKYNNKINVKRIRVDIQHLSLEGVEGIGDYQHIVGLGKHLCGSASDLSLRCLCNHRGSTSVSGVVLALCCHHRCVWESYCGMDILQGLGVLPSEFYILTALTGWATCNSKDVPPSNEVNNTSSSSSSQAAAAAYTDVNNAASQEGLRADVGLDKETTTTITVDKKQMENRYTRLNLSAQYRECVGRKAKQVLDYGRQQYMCEQGFQCSLIQYVTMDATPENVALIATRPKHSH